MAASTETKAPKITLHWLEWLSDGSFLVANFARLEVSRSHRILWLLEELQIPYELRTWKRGSDKRADPGLKEIHPLGKSPILTVDREDGQDPLVLIESAAIVEYLCDYYGRWLVPARFKSGYEGQIGHETESWVRYRTYMHYAEGSLMPLNLIALLMSSKWIITEHSI